MREAIEEAFWSFVDQKWRNALNVAAAEQRGGAQGAGRAPPMRVTEEGQQRPRSWHRQRYM